MKRIAIALALVASPVAAHGPWPYECCASYDCAEVDEQHITERDGRLYIDLPPGSHPMVPKGGPGWKGSIEREKVRRPLTGSYGVCINGAGVLLCVFDQMRGT